jgi:hypothetical protein
MRFRGGDAREGAGVLAEAGSRARRTRASAPPIRRLRPPFLFQPPHQHQTTSRIIQKPPIVSPRGSSAEPRRLLGAINLSAFAKGDRLAATSTKNPLPEQHAVCEYVHSSTEFSRPCRSYVRQLRTAARRDTHPAERPIGEVSPGAHSAALGLILWRYPIAHSLLTRITPNGWDCVFHHSRAPRSSLSGYFHIQPPPHSRPATGRIATLRNALFWRMFRPNQICSRYHLFGFRCL